MRRRWWGVVAGLLCSAPGWAGERLSGEPVPALSLPSWSDDSRLDRHGDGDLSSLLDDVDRTLSSAQRGDAKVLRDDELKSALFDKQFRDWKYSSD